MMNVSWKGEKASHGLGMEQPLDIRRGPRLQSIPGRAVGNWLAVLAHRISACAFPRDAQSHCPQSVDALRKKRQSGSMDSAKFT